MVFPGATPGSTETKSWGKLYRHLERSALLARIHKNIAPQVFRATYCPPRLQTTDNGAPVAAWTVKAEMGHSSLAMIEQVYGRLGTFRHRSPVVEYLSPASESAGLSAQRIENL